MAGRRVLVIRGGIEFLAGCQADVQDAEKMCLGKIGKNIGDLVAVHDVRPLRLRPRYQQRMPVERLVQALVDPVEEHEECGGGILRLNIRDVQRAAVGDQHNVRIGREDLPPVRAFGQARNCPRPG